MIDWSKIPDWVQYVSVSSNGKIVYHAHRPQKVVGLLSESYYWCEGKNSLTHVFPWESSLVKRPEAVPNYYHPGKYEVIGLVKEMDFISGNAVKYIARCNYKGQKKSDIEKAINYISMADSYRRLEGDFVIEEYIEDWGITGNIAEALRCFIDGRFDEAIAYLEKELDDLG